MELMYPFYWELPVNWNWFCNHAELFKKVDKKTSKELSEKHNCKVKECYYNAFMSDIGRKYRYFEGYVQNKGLPLTAHSWLVDSKGNVIDPTLIIDVPAGKDDEEIKNRCGDYYIGIEIPRDWLRKTLLKSFRTESTLVKYYNYKKEKSDLK